MSTLIGQQPDMAIVGEADSASAALAAAQTPADVAVVDYHLSDHNGLWLAARLRALSPAPRILVFSAFADGALAAAALVAGADGLVAKSSTGAELCTAIRQLHRGGRYLPTISPSLARSMAACLSERDQAVFGFLVHGVAPPDIAARLRITIPELDAQRTAILAVLAPAASRARIRPTAGTPLRYERARPTPSSGPRSRLRP
jgi:DNA-binding NarL/FixJ family response regulator